MQIAIIHEWRNNFNFFSTCNSKQQGSIIVFLSSRLTLKLTEISGREGLGEEWAQLRWERWVWCLWRMLGGVTNGLDIRICDSASPVLEFISWPCPEMPAKTSAPASLICKELQNIVDIRIYLKIGNYTKSSKASPHSWWRSSRHRGVAEVRMRNVAFFPLPTLSGLAK